MEYPKNLLEEQFMKPEEIEVGWPWRLLVFTLFIFGITLVIFLGMQFGYGPYLDKKIQNLDAKINELNQSLNQSEVDNFIKFYSQISNLKTLLDKHIFGSNILKFLEANTLKSLVYTSANLDIGRNKEIKLRGIAPNFEALSQQLEIFRQSDSVKDITFKDASSNEKGGIEFEITLILKDNFFKEGFSFESIPNQANQATSSTSTQP